VEGKKSLERPGQGKGCTAEEQPEDGASLGHAERKDLAELPTREEKRADHQAHFGRRRSIGIDSRVGEGSTLKRQDHNRQDIEAEQAEAAMNVAVA
jgi:hypothetical protein